MKIAVRKYKRLIGSSMMKGTFSRVFYMGFKGAFKHTEK